MCCQSSDTCPEGSGHHKEWNKSDSLLINSFEEEIDKKISKNEGKLRIFFYGENILNILIKQTSIQFKEDKIKNTSFKQGFDNAFNWEFFEFDKICDESNKIITDFVEKDFIMSDFFDIIIITVNKLLDEDSILFFKHFEKFTTQRVKQPFILYITKEEENPKVEQLYDKITNEYFDKRTLFALKYPNLVNENETKAILELICKFRNYYHEEGDSFEYFNEEITSNYKFNILVCGRAGTGKSSFINKFLGNRKAKEGEGLSVTHKIVTYSHQKYPINISDTPGFEDEKTLKKVKSLLDLYNKKLIDGRKKINLIIYIFPYSERSVLSLELPLLENLVGYNTKIIFVMNFVTESIQKSHYKRIHQICIDNLKKILPKDFEIKLYPINLFSQIDDDDIEFIKVIKSFGLDTLFEDIFLYFKNSITDIDNIKKMKTSEELFRFFDRNILFNHYKQINDIFISFRSELINIILSYGRMNRLSFQKEKNMETMADLLFMKCIGKKCDKYEYYLSQLSLEDDIEYLFDKFTEDIAILKSYNQQIHTMYFYQSIHHHKTLALGYLCMKDLQKIFESSPNIFMENDKINFDLIINLCNSYNQAINGFHSMAETFQKSYELEKKKNKEYIKNSKNKGIKNIKKEDNNNMINQDNDINKEDKKNIKEDNNICIKDKNNIKQDNNNIKEDKTKIEEKNDVTKKDIHNNDINKDDKMNVDENNIINKKVNNITGQDNNNIKDDKKNIVENNNIIRQNNNFISEDSNINKEDKMDIDENNIIHKKGNNITGQDNNNINKDDKMDIVENNNIIKQDNNIIIENNNMIKQDNNVKNNIGKDKNINTKEDKENKVGKIEIDEE